MGMRNGEGETVRRRAWMGIGGVVSNLLDESSSDTTTIIKAKPQAASTASTVTEKYSAGDKTSTSSSDGAPASAVDTTQDTQSLLTGDKTTTKNWKEGAPARGAGDYTTQEEGYHVDYTTQDTKEGLHHPRHEGEDRHGETDSLMEVYYFIAQLV